MSPLPTLAVETNMKTDIEIRGFLSLLLISFSIFIVVFVGGGVAP